MSCREAAVRKLYRWLAIWLLAFFILYLASALYGPASARPALTAAHETARRRLAAADHPATPELDSSVRTLRRSLLLERRADGGDLGLTAAQRVVRAALFLSVSLINLLAVSTMWARAADVFSSDAGETALARPGRCISCCLYTRRSSHIRAAASGDCPLCAPSNRAS